MVAPQGSVSSLSSMLPFVDDGDNGDDDMFEDLDENEEETFVSTSKRSAINILRLPYVPPELSAANMTTSTSLTLYLHVGPVHAGVPQLYEQLRHMDSDLLQDKLIVANASSHPQLNVPALHVDCQSTLVSTRKSYAERIHLPGMFGKQKSLAETLRDVPCWKSFLDTLDVYGAQGASVFIADDRLSHQVIPDIYGLDGPGVLDWISIKETLQANWNIVVIANYRRYFDWLPAAKGADEQVHMEQHTAELPRLARWPRNEGGMYLEPLFPHFIRHAMKKLDVPYTKRVVELYGGFAETRILDLYAPVQSVRTTLLCDVLKDRPLSCAASHRMDADAGEEANSAAAVLDVEGEYAWSDFQLFDELVTTAAQRNILRFRHVQRVTATITTEYYIKTYLGIHPRRDLPLKCPKKGELEDYLKVSIQLERELLGVHADSVHKDLLKREFNQQMEDRMFCAMNMRKLFRDRSWREVLRHLTNKSAKRIQAGGEPGPQPFDPLQRLLEWTGFR